MDKYLDIIKEVVLFKGIESKEIEKVLGCLNHSFDSYKKNSIIFQLEQKISKIGIVLEGNVQVVKEDIHGNRTIITELYPGEIFGEVFACAELDKSPVIVMTVDGCKILFVDYVRIITTCASACIFHTQLIENMLKLIATKNLLLNQRIELLSKRTIREKVISYLSTQIEKHNSNNFEIHLNRSELADYLSVDRSAMSRELGKMRDEGLIRFDLNTFEILDLQNFI